MGHLEIVTQLLKDNPQGLTIEELSARSRLSRVTVRTILEGLKGSKQIKQRDIGRAKLNYWIFK